MQAAGGRYMRMALILKLLSEKEKSGKVREGKEDATLTCKNPSCITCERGVKKLFSEGRCIYCDSVAVKI